MTSSTLLTDLFLKTLRDAEPGTFAARTPAEKHDLATARSLTTEQRLERLNDILLLAEAHGLPPVSHHPTRHHDLRI